MDIEMCIRKMHHRKGEKMKKIVLLVLLVLSLSVKVYALEDNSLVVPDVLNVVENTNSLLFTEFDEIKLTTLKRLYGPYYGNDYNIYYEVNNIIGTDSKGLYAHNSGYARDIYRSVNGRTNSSNTPMPSDDVSILIGAENANITNDPISLSIIYETRYYFVPVDFDYTSNSGEFIHYVTSISGVTEVPESVIEYTPNDMKIPKTNGVSDSITSGAVAKFKLTDLYSYIKNLHSLVDSTSDFHDYGAYCSSIGNNSYLGFCNVEQGSNVQVNIIPLIKIREIRMNYTIRVNSQYNDKTGEESATQVFHTLFGMFSSATYNQTTVDLNFNHTYGCGIELSKDILGCFGPSFSLDIGNEVVNDVINKELMINRYIHVTQTIKYPGGAYANKTHVKYNDGSIMKIDSFVKGDWSEQNPGILSRPTFTILGANQSGYQLQLTNNAPIPVSISLTNGLTGTHSINGLQWVILTKNFGSYNQTSTINAQAFNQPQNIETQFYNTTSSVTSYAVSVAHKVPIVTIDQQTPYSFRIQVRNQNNFAVPMYYNLNGINYYLGYASSDQTLTKTINNLQPSMKISLTVYSFANTMVSVRYTSTFFTPAYGLEQ
ncbi:hypothetical protein N7603_00480 [Acholeplasma vituli]|uniref:Uncharacterized protein n=1 Tax=Paracholeplasma vituli TaxID=69473 RepID=A0ABT2PT64_9MOLU|nr:hypothetical protein [Paracholeplasma vituli]MCU0104136.1 hypothetical protein [Paracholeplasma vituli]